MKYTILNWIPNLWIELTSNPAKLKTLVESRLYRNKTVKKIDFIWILGAELMAHTSNPNWESPSPAIDPILITFQGLLATWMETATASVEMETVIRPISLATTQSLPPSWRMAIPTKPKLYFVMKLVMMEILSCDLQIE